MITESEYRSASASAQRAFAAERRTRTWAHVVNQAVGTNTFRAFARRDKSIPGASAVFHAYMTDAALITSLLQDVHTEEQLDDLEDSMVDDLLTLLSHNIKPDRLTSYNRVRKVVDLYLVHLVAATQELAGDRQRLVPLLFLPLDSQTLSRVWGEKSSMGSITTRAAYLRKQADAKQLAQRVARDLAIPFHRIYFDQFWSLGGRQERWDTPWLNYFREARP